MTNAISPTLYDYIDTGLRLGLSARRSLELYRECGGRIRNEDWYTRWRDRRAAYLRREQ